MDLLSIQDIAERVECAECTLRDVLRTSSVKPAYSRGVGRGSVLLYKASDLPQLKAEVKARLDSANESRRAAAKDRWRQNVEKPAEAPAPAPVASTTGLEAQIKGLSMRLHDISERQAEIARDAADLATRQNAALLKAVDKLTATMGALYTELSGKVLA